MAFSLPQSDSQIKLCENEMDFDSALKNDPTETTPIAVGDVDEEALVSNLKTPSSCLPIEAALLPATTRKISLSTSSNSNESDYPDICRICHCEGTNEEPLISPCNCLGTMQYLHQSCLQRWIKSAGVKSCELCKFEFIMHAEIKPFKQWQKLDMNIVERRKVMCSVAFNLIAVTCILWSLHVLIDRTREEVKMGKLHWPFWTKLIVVAIGFTGGLVFLYVQCKMYLQLCIRWRQFNQRIVIHSISEQRDGGTSPSDTRNHNNNSDANCIVTVLDVNDLPPLTSNSSPSATGDRDAAVDSVSRTSTTATVNRNRRHRSDGSRNFLHRLLIFHRSDHTQT